MNNEKNDLRVFKGGRWFVKYRGTTSFSYGFKSKADALRWIQIHPALDQQFGGRFYLKCVNDPYDIVNRKGEEMRV